MTGGAQRGPHDVRPALLRTPSVTPEDLADDRARALELTPVSRETAGRLERFVALLLDWQRRVNLIAPSTAPTLWTRHIADSLQLLSVMPDARVWADLGSGAGFPGLVLACALAETPGARVYLVESNTKKIAFLREAVRVVDAPAIVRGERVEEFVNAVPEAVDVVTARAYAPLCDLLEKAYPLLVKGTVGLFPKGQAVEAELTQAAKCWRVQATLTPSRTDPRAQIVTVRGLQPKSATPARRELAKR
jgi:16S rRNA (guanine527-N7)-methyltransferase